MKAASIRFYLSAVVLFSLLSGCGFSRWNRCEMPLTEDRGAMIAKHLAEMPLINGSNHIDVADYTMLTLDLHQHGLIGDRADEELLMLVAYHACMRADDPQAWTAFERVSEFIDGEYGAIGFDVAWLYKHCRKCRDTFDRESGARPWLRAFLEYDWGI